jgi:hypothetical protein
LLGSLLNFLFDNFRACSRPETYLVRADESLKQSEKHGKTVTLVGASNLGHSTTYFSDPDMTFLGVTVAGWTPCPENVKKMVSAVEEKSKNSDAFVFDLLGNVSVRFEQFDGTTALPYKSNGKYHLAGRVVMTPSETFKKIVQSITPIIQAKGNKPCVVLPPLPRYLFSRCCSDSNHCTNANDPDFHSTLMSGFVRLKNELIQQLVSQGITNFKVMDSCCVTSAPTTASIDMRLSELKKVCSNDGIHFVDAGYKNMASRVTDCLKTMMNKQSVPKKQSTYFWRGFRSRHGSSLPRNFVARSGGVEGGPARGGSRGRPRGSPLSRRPWGFHPYRRR